MIPINDLKRSVSGQLLNDLEQSITKVVASGSYILGEEVNNFEREFAAYLGVRFVSSVASGTDALVIALRSIGVKRDSKVLLTPNAGGYTTSALIEIGAEPVFIDCDAMGRIQLESLDRQLRLTPNPVCIVVTHLYGLSSNIEQVAAICLANGIKLLEDCAQAAGAQVGGKKLGSFGDVSTFSFYPTKNLGALGDCGAIATNSKPLAIQHRALRQYGWSSRYQVVIPYGMNSRMDELQAAVLRVRLPQLDGLNIKRKKIWSMYESALQGSNWGIIGNDTAGFVAHLGVLVAPTGLRESARDFLDSRGIATDIHYPQLDYEQPGWSGILNGYCPEAQELSRRIFSVPLFPELSNNEVETIAIALREMTMEL